jgi:hypothetical protein
MTTRNLSLALVTALAAASGCTTDSPSDGAETASDAAGAYRLKGSVDISGTKKMVELRDAVKTVAEKPTQTILTHMIAALTGEYKSKLQQYYNQMVTAVGSSYGTKFAPAMNTLLMRLDDATHHFGMTDMLEVTRAGEDYVATITTSGLRFVIDGVDVGLPFAEQTGGTDGAIREPFTPGLRVSVDDDGAMEIAEHELAFPYARALLTMMNKAIVPAVDSTAKDLATLVWNNIDCVGLATALTSAMRTADNCTYCYNAQTFADACGKAKTSTAAALEKKITYTSAGVLDTSQMSFAIAGTAMSSDGDGDGRIDAIDGGAWAGTTTNNGVELPIAGSFTGARL